MNNSDISENLENDDILILTENDFRSYDNEVIRKCNGFTLKGKSCSNKPCKNEKYCKLHLEKFRLSKPDECAVCMESLENVHIPLSCSHWVHKECIIEWGKDQCPICRAKIKLTTQERKKMDSKKRTPPEDAFGFAGYEDEIEYPPQFIEYLSSLARTISQDLHQDEIDEQLFHHFFIINIDNVPENILSN